MKIRRLKCRAARRFWARPTLSVAILLLLGTGAHAQMTVEQRREEVGKLDWQRGGTHQLAESHSTIALPADRFVALAQDAARFETLIGNSSVAQKHVEAVVLTRDDQQVIFQSFNDQGYVTLDDWKDVDATTMLDSIRENTASENARRTQEGAPSLTVTGWLQQPTLDRQANTVRWSIALTEGDKPIVNAVALRLGRHGFEKLTWVGDASAYKPVDGELDLNLNAHSFDPGSRYADYVSGDKVAAYGVGALVATIVGAKLVKVGVLAGVLAVFKKAVVFIVVAIAAALARFWRAIFRKRQVASPSTDVTNPPA